MKKAFTWFVQKKVEKKSWYDDEGYHTKNEVGWVICQWVPKFTSSGTLEKRQVMSGKFMLKADAQRLADEWNAIKKDRKLEEVCAEIVSR